MREDLDFAQETIGADRRGHLGAEYLDRDFPLELQILGEIDRGHTTPPELALEGVTVGEGGLQALKGGFHGALR